MREHKFKIYYQHEDTGYITSELIVLGDLISNIGRRWFVIGKSQYIGFKDKNDKEIYEDDIAKIEGCNNGIIKWYENDAGFGINALDILITSNDISFKDYSPNFVEIIGNKYNNPELLEKK